MATVIYIVRHGESEGNRHERFLGHTDLPLTDRGRRQAALAGAYLKEKKISFDRVFASPLCRAYETAEIVAGAVGYAAPPLPLPGMMEIAAGKWENREYAALMREFPHSYGELWRHHIGLAAADGGETVRSLAERAMRTVFSVAAENEGKTVLIGTHATPLRAVETYARGLPVAEMERVPFAPNASLSAYCMEAGGTVQSLFYAFCDYLGAEATFFPSTV